MAFKYVNRFTAFEKRFIVALRRHGGPKIKQLFKLIFERDISLSTISRIVVESGNSLPKQQFKKGIVPWNKGTKGVMKVNAGSFKKGNTPPKKHPVGTERRTKEGAVEVKTRDNPSHWELRGRLVYMRHHKLKKIPEGYVIWHINGIADDDNIENLELIPRGQLVIICRYQHSKTPDELKNLVALRAKLRFQIGEKQRECRKSKTS